MSAIPGTDELAMFAMLATLLVVVVGPLDSQSGSGDGAGVPRTIVRGATLLPLRADDPTAAVTGMTIVIEAGKIVAIAPADSVTLGDRDIPVTAWGGFVIPGLIEVETAHAPSFASLAGRPLRGVTTVVAPVDPQVTAWLRRIEASSAFSLPNLVGRPRSDLEPASWPSARPPASGSPDGGFDPGPAGAKDRALWLRERSIGLAEKLRLPDRTALAVGGAGDLVVLRENPLDDLAALRSPFQVVVAGDPIRISEVAGRQEIIDRAASAQERWPATDPDDLVYAIESGGLAVGRCEVRPDGRRGIERWAPPVGSTSTWTWSGSDEKWTATLSRNLAPRGVANPDERRPVEAAPPSLSASIERLGHQLKVSIQASDGQQTSTTIDATVDGPLFDPVSLVLAKRAAIVALEVGERGDFEVVELIPRPSGFLAGVRTIRLTRIAPGDAPMPADPANRSFRIDAVVTRSGTEVVEHLGWIATDLSGTPERVALVAIEGITEYWRCPDSPKSQPVQQSPP